MPFTLLLWLTLVHGIAATTDGVSTKYWERKCWYCYEEPVVRPFIGRRPTWSRMLPAGVLEVGAAAWIGHELKKHHKKYWWVPQVALIAAHTSFAISNYKRKY